MKRNGSHQPDRRTCCDMDRLRDPEETVSVGRRRREARRAGADSRRAADCKDFTIRTYGAADTTALNPARCHAVRVEDRLDVAERVQECPALLRVADLDRVPVARHLILDGAAVGDDELCSLRYGRLCALSA